MSHGLASVLVPAHDEERYIAEALESALAQDYPDVEIIVADDGSTDRTVEIAESYGVVTLRGEHAGPASARNRALAASTGAFITVLDADDVWPADRLSAQIGHLAEHPEHDLVMGLTRPFHNPGEAPPAHYPLVRGTGDVPAVAGTALARRRVFDAIGPWDESLRLSEDVDWLARVKDAGFVAASLDHLVLHYRIHELNTSRNTAANKDALLKVLRQSVRRQKAAE